VKKRQLTEDAAKAIRRSFYERIVKGVDAQAQARLFADHACALLELGEEDTKGWYAAVSPAPSAKTFLQDKERCEWCGKMTRITTAGCDHCNVEAK